MMYLKLGLSWLLLLTLGVKAGPLQWGHVSEDAKWVAHIDFEGLRQTSLYNQLSEKFLKQPMAEAEAKIEQSTGLKIKLDSLLSITAFGKSTGKSPDEDGVLVLEMSPDLKKIAMDILSKAQQNEGPKLPVSIQHVEGGVDHLFSIDGEILIAGDSDSNFFCIGRNKDRVEKSISILGTSKQGGPVRSQFKEYPSPKGTLAYVAMANAFDGANLPAQQAKVLQMSKGASFALGESNESIFLKLLLNTKNSGDSLQIQRILAGVQAVAMLNAQQPEWFPVLQAIDIRNEDQRVWVNWNMSLQNAKKLIHALQGSKK